MFQCSVSFIPVTTVLAPTTSLLNADDSMSSIAVQILWMKFKPRLVHITMNFGDTQY